MYIFAILLLNFFYLGHLKSKSEFNVASAEVLIDEDYYAPSVHCSYYGVFQYISSKLNSLGKTYEEVSNDIRESRKSGGKVLNSHEYPIKLILEEVKKKTDDIYSTKLKDKIDLLKTFRKESDYLNISINMEQGKESLRLSKEIISVLKTKI
jgi:hypothetical protein